MSKLPSNPTNFELVAHMNNSFGNPQGDARDFLPMPDFTSETEVHFSAIPWNRLEKQCTNIQHEYWELMGNPETGAKGAFQKRDLDGVRDALCDIMVFAYGAFHFLGIDADADMQTVLKGVMTRFIKDDMDKQATIAKHAANGITDVYFEGDYPTMVMKSASDQPDAPHGKFLKSASYVEPVFSKISFPDETGYDISSGSEIMAQNPSKIPGAFDPQPIAIDCKTRILNSHDGGANWTDIRTYGIQYDCTTLNSAKTFLIHMFQRTDGTRPVVEEKDGIYSVVCSDGTVEDRFMIEL